MRSIGSNLSHKYQHLGFSSFSQKWLTFELLLIPHIPYLFILIIILKWYLLYGNILSLKGLCVCVCI